MSRAIHRVCAVMFGLWFTVFTAEPGRLHACPLHDGAGASGVSGHTGHASHPTNGLASHDAASHAAAGDHSTPNHQGHQCTCPDKCCCAGVHALATSSEPSASGLVAVVDMLQDSGAAA